MLLTTPIFISSCLLPAIKIGDATISIDYAKLFHEEGHRVRYRWWVDFADGQEFYGDDLSTGCNHGLQHALESLLSFMAACGEAYHYTMSTGRESDNLDLFPEGMREWCYLNSDELSMAECELQETPGLINEG